MRLINYGTGEICDRLSILGLKILHTRRAGHPVTHFEKERGSLIAKLAARKDGVQADVWSGLFELAAVNGGLWQAEDEMRTLREKTAPPIGNLSDALAMSSCMKETVACAFRIQELNDLRAEVISFINHATGEHHGREKLLPAGPASPAVQTSAETRRDP